MRGFIKMKRALSGHLTMRRLLDSKRGEYGSGEWLGLCGSSLWRTV